MLVTELLEARQLTRAEKEAKRASALAAKKQAFINDKYGDDDYAIVTLPVLLSGKWVKRDFIIDNTHQQHSKASALKLVDMGQIESNPRDREENEGDAKYSIYGGKQKFDTSSVPKFLHGLPPRTRHNDPKNPEDLRRAAYIA